MPEMDARIPLQAETRDDLRQLKRGGETWNDLLRKMAEQYDPEQGR